MRYFSEELKILDNNTARFMLKDLRQRCDDLQEQLQLSQQRELQLLQKVQKVLQLLQDPGVMNDPQMLKIIEDLQLEIEQVENGNPQNVSGDQP